MLLQFVDKGDGPECGWREAPKCLRSTADQDAGTRWVVAVYNPRRLHTEK
jgi:hypothetical protein